MNRRPIFYYFERLFASFLLALYLLSWVPGIGLTLQEIKRDALTLGLIFLGFSQVSLLRDQIKKGERPE